MMKKFSLLLFSFLLLSCTSLDEESGNTEPLPEESSLELTEIAKVGHINDEIYFSSFRKLMVTSEGEIILNDWRQQALYYFDRDGNFLEQIGREGRGPGEFTDLYGLLLAPGDTIHTFDRNNSRHQILARVDGSWQQVREHPLEQKFSEELHTFYPEKVYPGSGDSYWALFRNNIGIRDTTTMYHEWIMPVDANLEPLSEEKLLLSPSQVTLVARNENTVISSWHPNSYRVFAEFDPDQGLLHRAYNTDATIRVTDPNGNEQRRIQLPFENVPPDDEQKQRYLKNLKNNSSYDNQDVSRAEDLYFDYRAYVSQFILDDRDRYWIQVPRLEDSSPEWIVVDSGGSILGSFSPDDLYEDLEYFNLSDVQGNRLYGYGSENDEPVFVILEASGLDD